MCRTARNAGLALICILLQLVLSSDTQTCYKALLKYRTVTTYSTAYKSSSYGCNWFLWNWSTCYRSVSYSVSQPTVQAYYSQSAYCCSGFAGSPCRDIDECSSSSTNNCNNPAYCVNTFGGYTCKCPSGYTLNSNSISCSDVNECSAGTHNCFSDDYCINTAGSFLCYCPTGYSKQSDGHTCIDINECLSGDHDCFSDQYCHNNAGSYSCSCPSGYQLQSNMVTCKDIDECQAGADGCQQMCTNSLGSYTCSCALGCNLSQDQHSCIDTDECTDGTAGCGQLCTNLHCQNGRYTCSCYDGGQYFLGPDDHICFHGATVTSLPPSISRLFSETLILQCVAVGLPLPDISWLKDNENIPASQRVTIETFISNDTLGKVVSTLSIPQLNVLDEGEYSCKAVNTLPVGLSQDISTTVLNITEILAGNVTGYATSPLSIYLFWKEPMEPSLIALVESYFVFVEEMDTGKNWNKTSQQTVMTITSLHPYYSYKLTVAATTNDTIQPHSTPIIVTTFQAAPSMPPMNAVVNLITSRSANITWDPPPPEHTNGIILYSVIHLTDLQSKLVQNITTISNWVLLMDLHPYYSYSFQVAAVTVSQGPFSDALTLTTLEDVPSAAPGMVMGDSITSKYIFLTWEPPPTQMHNGVIREYWISIVEIRTNASQLRITVDNFVNVSGLHPNYDYNFTVTMVTIGPGPPSPPVTMTTLEDVPSGFPTNITANATSPTSAKFKWDPPPFEQQNGLITGYDIIINDLSYSQTFYTTTNLTYLSIDFLLPFRTYTFFIAASTEVGTGPFSNVEAVINTTEAAPSAPPLNFHVVPGSVSSMGFHAEWNEPQPEHQNGIIDYYIISILETETNNVTMYTTVGLNLTLQNLHPFYNYELSVSAVTVGTGPFSPQINVTTHQQAPSGFPLDFSGVTISSTEIQFIWFPPRQEEQNGIIISYLLDMVALDRNHTFQINITNTTTHVNNLNPYTTYSCTVAANTIVGLGPFSFPIYITMPEDAPSDAPLNPSVLILDSETVNVSWYPPALEHQNGAIIYYVVSVLDVNTYDMSTFISYSTTLQLPSLHPHYQYNIKIAAVTIAQGPFTEEMSILMPEDVPSGPPTNITLFNVTSSSMTVSWDPPSPVDANGIITGYTLQFNRSSSRNTSEINSTSEKLHFTIYGLLPYEAVSIAVAAKTLKGLGPLSQEVTYRTAEDLPSAPQSLEATQENSTTVTLSWNSPQHPNGELLGYQVLYTPSESSGVKMERDDHGEILLPASDNPVAVITKLSEGLLYNFEVSAWNGAGYGESSSITLQLEISERGNDSLSMASTIIAIVFGCIIFMLISVIAIVLYLIVVRSRKRILDVTHVNRNEAKESDIDVELKKLLEANDEIGSVEDNKAYLKDEMDETKDNDCGL